MFIDNNQNNQSNNDLMEISAIHYVNGESMKPPFNSNLESAQFGMGCFWGVERIFWGLDGVFVTAVGYAAGSTINPTYNEVCGGATGHNEVVLVVFDPSIISYSQLLIIFWQSHNPTQGNKQGNDEGTQYRSGIYVYSDQQQKSAEDSRLVYQNNLSAAGIGQITTEISPASVFYYAEEYHQQYLAKNANGYCGLGGLGIDFR